MGETHTSSRGSAVTSWIALILGVITSLGALLAIVIAVQFFTNDASDNQNYGFLFLIVTTYLCFLGPLSLIAGLVGKRFSKSGDANRRRSWFAVIVGVVTLLGGILFGVSAL